MSQFYGGIKSYDIHTYWHNNNPQETKFAYALRQQLQQEFKEDIDNGDLRVYKFWDKPIGPHPINMFEIDFNKPELFTKLVPFFQLNHGNLSVLIHPRTGNDVLDHTKHAIWLGHKQRLDISLLESL